jgi:hypothetical protein
LFVCNKGIFLLYFWPLIIHFKINIKQECTLNEDKTPPVLKHFKNEVKAMKKANKSFRLALVLLSLFVSLFASFHPQSPYRRARATGSSRSASRNRKATGKQPEATGKRLEATTRERQRYSGDRLSLVGGAGER